MRSISSAVRSLLAAVRVPCIACAALAALAAAAHLPSQIFVVDINNGPGTHFTSLVTAAASAPDGATLLVRPGAYPGLVTIDGKGLKVLADPGVSIVSGGILVQNTLPQHSNVLRNLTYQDFPPPFPALGAVKVQNCAGPVVFERLTATAYGGLSDGLVVAVTIGSSAQVLLRESTVVRLAVGSSQVALEDCTIHGRGAKWPSLTGSWPSTPAVELSGVGSTLEVSRSLLRGGAGDCLLITPCQPGQTPALPNSPAVNINGSTLVLRTPSSVESGVPGWTIAPVTGTGTVRIDPQVTLNNPLAVTPPAVLQPMPTVRSTSAPLLGAITASATGPAGDLLILIVGLPGPQLTVPGIADPFWLSPALYFFAAIGVAQPGVPLTSSAQVPNDPNLLGFRLAWQAVSRTGTAALQASNPSWALVHP